MNILFSCSHYTKQESSTHTIQEPAKPIAASTLKYTSGVRAVLHDSQGNYWIGSHQEGVCKFDGKTFTYFTMAEGLSDNQIRTIQEDANGVIWFGTGNGVSSYKEGHMHNHNIANPLAVLPSLVDGEWALSANDLWFNARNQSGVYRFDGELLNYLAFPMPTVDSLPNLYSVTGFSRPRADQLWIATYGAVVGYNGDVFEIIYDKTIEATQPIAPMHIRSILEDSNGNLWIGNNGIGVLLKQQDSIINFSQQQGLVHPESTGQGDRSPAGTLEHVFVIAEDKEGNIWFGDRDTGAWMYDGTTMTNYLVDASLETPMVWDIYEDRTGNLLFSMADGGVYQFNGKGFDRKF